MTINKKLEHWQEITNRLEIFLDKYYAINKDGSDETEFEIVDSLMKQYGKTYGVCYDPLNKPGGELE